MVSAARHELGTAGERTGMYSDGHEDEGEHEEKDTPSVSDELEQDYRDLERQIRNLKMWSYSLGLLFSLCFIMLLFSLGAKRMSTKTVVHKPTPVSEMPIKPVLFQQYDVFANHSNPDSDDAWSAIMPAGDGFVVVKDPQRYGLQPGKDSDQGSLYDISVFHQLHCLKHIRTYLYTTLEVAQKNAHDDATEKFLNHPDEHVFHCFDYIRQALMCNADMTVEWPRVEEDGSRFAVDGWGIDHQCKDWDSVMAWMEENRFRQPWEVGSPVFPN